MQLLILQSRWKVEVCVWKERNKDREVRDGGFTAHRSQQCGHADLFQKGVEGREEGREGGGERGRGRQTPTPWHLALSASRGETGGSRCGGLCEAQPTCWSSKRETEPRWSWICVKPTALARDERPQHVSKTAALRRFGCVPRGANLRWI